MCRHTIESDEMQGVSAILHRWWVRARQCRSLWLKSWFGRLQLGSCQIRPSPTRSVEAWGLGLVAQRGVLLERAHPCVIVQSFAYTSLCQESTANHQTRPIRLSWEVIVESLRVGGPRWVYTIWQPAVVHHHPLTFQSHLPLTHIHTLYYNPV